MDAGSDVLRVDPGGGQSTLRAMLPHQCAGLPALSGKARRLPEHTRLIERLRCRPSGVGAYLWIQVRKVGLSSQQAAAALARAGGCEPSEVRFTEARDRHSDCEQWFSVPEDAVTSPASLRNAGYKRLLRVLAVQANDRPVSVGLVQDLQVQARIVGGAAEGGYQRAKELMNHLRQHGCPNYIGAVRMGKGGQWAKWGRLLVKGKRLPAAVKRQKVPVRQCLVAAQAQLFNRYVAARLAAGELRMVLAGDLLRTACNLAPSERGRELVTEDRLAEMQKRVDSWEAVPMGPLFGSDLPAVTAVAAAREAACLAEADFELEDWQRLPGNRRAVAIQPRQVETRIDRDDLLIACELDEEAFVSVLLEELLQPTGHLS